MIYMAGVPGAVDDEGSWHAQHTPVLGQIRPLAGIHFNDLQALAQFFLERLERRALDGFAGCAGWRGEINNGSLPGLVIFKLFDLVRGACQDQAVSEDVLRDPQPGDACRNQ